MRSAATTVPEYLAALADDRRLALSRVRAVILANLPPGYEEAMNWGMIAYQVPLATCPVTYNGQPLMLAALASQKNHMAVYLSGLYCGVPGVLEAFEQRYRDTGLKLDRGKSCVQFRRLEMLDLDAVGEVIASVPVEALIAAATRTR